MLKQMPTHAEQKKLPYSAQQLFDLVSDVGSYPEFLPWCLSSKIVRNDGPDIFYADLVVGYKFIREAYSSRVTLDRGRRYISVEYISGPMKHLTNHWRFVEEEDGGCLVDFYVQFDFKNPLLQKLIVLFFNEVVKKMVGAFEKRADDLYSGKQNRRVLSTVSSS